MGWKRPTCISSSGELADNEHRASASAVASHDMSCSASAGRAPGARSAGVPISLSLVAGRELRCYHSNHGGIPTAVH